MIVNSQFKPAWWLPGPHGQTLWPALIKRKVLIESRRERLELPDGDFLDIDWVGEGDGPLVIILHGLEGSIESHYARGLLKAITSMGWRGVLMHFRGCSGEPNRKITAYHSSETSDFNWFMRELKQREPDTQKAAIGYSMGGNVLLKWLGERAQESDEILKQLTTAVAVSVPFDLRMTADRLKNGVSQLYQWHLMKSLRGSILKKLKSMQMPLLDLERIPELKTFWEFDEYVTAPLYGFTSANDYYEKSSSRPYIKHIVTPTLVIHALDDPFMVPEIVPTETELSPSVSLELSRRGGHVGFITGSRPYWAKYWLESRIPQYLKQYFD